MTKKANRGPWSGGYTSSVPAFMSREDQLTGATDGLDVTSSRDVNIDPFTGGVSMRSGCTIHQDTISGALEVNGLTNKKMGYFTRKLFGFDSSSLTNGYPTIGVLFGKDTNAGFPNNDSGFPGTIYVSSTNATALTDIARNFNLLQDFVNGQTYDSSPSGTTAASSGSVYVHKVVPIWVESGAGLYNRGVKTGTGGTDAFLQQFLTSGSRNVLVTQNWLFSPNLRATPWRWNKAFNDSSSGTDVVRIYPTGPLPPLHPPTVTTPASSSSSTSWDDGDTFYLSVMFQFEDGSYSLPFIPRAANATLTSGLGLCTVGTIGGTAKYQYLTYSNVPLGPTGTVARVILRTTKQKRAATTDGLTLSTLDLRIVGVLRNNTQKTYLDYNGNDTTLLSDDDVVRLDYVMPRRARYIGTGDQRVLLSYTLPNTASILLAPVGVTIAYDRNHADTNSNCYGNTGSYIRITSTDLELHYNPGAAPVYDTAPTYSGTAGGNAVKFPFSTYDTIEKLVDAINKSDTVSNCKQWAAQIAPGLDGSMPSASLTPTTQSFSCTTDATTKLVIGTLADYNMIPVGAEVSGTNITAGTYVVSKTVASGPTEYRVTLSTAATGSTTTTRIFYCNTGDEGFVTGGTKGYMRSFSQTFPALVHMQASAFPNYDKPDKTSVYFTVSSPGAASSGVSLAPNSWVAGNKRTPHSSPNQKMQRSCVGIVDIEGAAIVAYSDGIFLFQNRRGGISGEDFDYRLFTVSDTRGCISYLSLIAGNGWAAYATTEGIMVTDKNAREYCISKDIYNPSDGTGDLAYEILTSAASAASDSDDQLLSMAVLGSKLVCAFRSSQDGFSLACGYDFSPGIESSGVEELLNPESKSSYIWNPPHRYNFTQQKPIIGAIGSIRNASGSLEYITSVVNASIYGDGRIERVNYGTTDNGYTVTPYACVSPIIPDEFMSIQPQVVEVTHKTTAGGAAVTFLEFANDQVPTYDSSLKRTLKVNASKTQYQKQRVEIDQGQRGKADIFWIRWTTQSSSAINRIWRIVIRYEESEITNE